MEEIADVEAAELREGLRRVWGVGEKDGHKVSEDETVP